ncbi:hypothetical protein [Plantibacter sp. YIM 135249]|jgi:hypothetical protein|uniref:hypothetical protein n=1 Tax=Plantibacter sp. YIM 135249 TaxID=3423918 RepID=UPI003D32F881
MSHEHPQPYDAPMQHAMGRVAQDAVVRDAITRTTGTEPAPLDSMQAAMGRERQIRSTHEALGA